MLAGVGTVGGMGGWNSQESDLGEYSNSRDECGLLHQARAWEGGGGEERRRVFKMKTKGSS